MKDGRGGIFIALPALVAVLLIALLPALCGCGDSGSNHLVIMASSDLEELGIVQAWGEDLQSRTGYEVETVFATDKKAAAGAIHGECDVLIMHLPSEEESLERNNYIEGRSELMQGTYVLVGPPDDPAGARDAENVTEAFRRIAENQKPFILRADGSGTAAAENRIWVETGVEEVGDWLIQTDEGMAETLRMASTQGAYTLSDLGNFQRLSGELNLDVILDGGEDALSDSYHVMQVSTLTYPDTNVKAARDFMEYVYSPAAQSYLNLGAFQPPPAED